MENIYNNLIDIIGNTPLLRLNNYIKAKNINADIIAKLEYLNPGGSVKDRVALAMIKDAEKKGVLNKNSVIIEPTSGNTGIGLAFIGAVLGYRVILTMPDTMSEERKLALKVFGAEIVLTKGSKGMAGAIEKAEELSKKIENSFIPRQFENKVNSDVHKNTTAKEILNDTDGNIDIFVSGVGTGGTITGIGEKLKQFNNNIKIVAVEPENSAVLSGEKPGAHKIQGIGAGFIPKVYNSKVIDEIIKISDEDAFKTLYEVAKLEGLLVGISSGAALCAASIIANKAENTGKKIVVLLPDTGLRYLSILNF